MPNALTLADMSPGLLEVVEKHESHQRKSRMVEISLSGSGEGLGWATAQPTLQAPFHALTPADTSPRQRRASPAGLTDGRAPQGCAPVAIGLGLTLMRLVRIPVTNPAVNPARRTGPALRVGG